MSKVCEELSLHGCSQHEEVRLKVSGSETGLIRGLGDLGA